VIVIQCVEVILKHSGIVLLGMAILTIKNTTMSNRHNNQISNLCSQILSSWTMTIYSIPTAISSICSEFSSYLQPIEPWADQTLTILLRLILQKCHYLIY
jgi:hypothetical protein